jgi:hypothetical protein
VDSTLQGSESIIVPETRVRTRIGVIVATVGSVIAGAFVAGGIYYSLRAHVGDGVVHLDSYEVRSKGGPVYKSDLRDAKYEIKLLVREESDRTRKVVQDRIDRPFVCVPRGRMLVCRVEDP